VYSFVSVLRKKSSLLFQNSFSPDVVVHFFLHISALLKAGFDIVSALTIFQESCTNKKLKSVIIAIKSDLQKGIRFSESISKYKNLFTSYMVISLKAAEISGAMSETFENLASHLIAAQRFRRKIVSSLRYPLFLIIILIVFLIVLGNFFLPNMQNNLLSINGSSTTDANNNQYMATQMLIGMLDFFGQYGIVLLALKTALGGTMYFFYNRSYKVKFLLQSILLKVPLIGYWVQQITMHKFVKIFSLMLNNNCDVLESLRSAIDSVKNIPILLSLKYAVMQVENGKKLSSAISKSGFANNMFCNYLKMGEETGKLKPILSQYIEFENENIERKLNTVATLTPNIVMMFIGLVLLWIVAATILPIYDSIGNMDL